MPPAPWAPPGVWYEIDEGCFTEWDRWLKTGPSTRQVAGWAQLVLRLQGWEVARAQRSWAPLPVATDGEAANPGPPIDPFDDPFLSLGDETYLEDEDC